jgi:hypothetical protein
MTDAEREIDNRIEQLGGWRGEKLAAVRTLMKQALPEVIEEWKWDNPVWNKDGIICTGEAYKAAIKLTFPKGASLKDPKRLFNSSLEGATRRALDIKESDDIDEEGLKALFVEAAELNAVTLASKKKKA